MSRIQLRGIAFCALALAIALCAWPRIPFYPLWGGDYSAWGLDFSWAVALHLAALQHLQWGRDVLFTYGPLGFLSVPLLISPWTSGLGLAFVAVMTVSLAATLLFALRRWMPLPLAWLAALAAAALLDRPQPEASVLCVILFAGLAVGRTLGPRVTALAPALVGALGGLLLLVKTSAGVAVAATLPFLVAAEPERLIPRGLAAAAGFSGALVLAWLAAGQSPAGLLDWLRGASELTAGYGEAMALEAQARQWEYAAFAGFVAAFAVVFAAGAERHELRRSALIVGILLATGFVFAKAGFVRHSDGEHSQIPFSLLVIAPLAVRWRSSWRAPGLALAIAAGVLLLWVRGESLGEAFGFVSRAGALRYELRAVCDPRKSSSIEAASKSELRARVSLPANVLDALRGHGVQADFDVAVLWAYDLSWAPVPVFQAYAAYTPSLDRANAQHLAEGPDRILRRRGAAIDGRSDLWETPEYSLAQLCRYREIATSDLWQVLARGPDRCGAEQPLGSAVAEPGEPIQISSPSAPDRIVVVHLEAPPSGRARLRALLLKPSGPLYARFGTRRERLVRANLGGPLLVRVPDACGWWSPAGGPLSISSFAIDGGEAPISARFAEIPLRDAGPPSPPPSIPLG